MYSTEVSSIIIEMHEGMWAKSFLFMAFHENICFLAPQNCVCKLNWICLPLPPHFFFKPLIWQTLCCCWHKGWRDLSTLNPSWILLMSRFQRPSWICKITLPRSPTGYVNYVSSPEKYHLRPIVDVYNLGLYVSIWSDYPPLRSSTKVNVFPVFYCIFPFAHKIVVITENRM